MSISVTVISILNSKVYSLSSPPTTCIEPVTTTVLALLSMIRLLLAITLGHLRLKMMGMKTICNRMFQKRFMYTVY